MSAPSMKFFVCTLRTLFNCLNPYALAFAAIFFAPEMLVNVGFLKQVTVAFTVRDAQVPKQYCKL